MQCQICQKDEATIHLTEITNGQRTEIHICEHCAKQQGLAAKNHMPINELLSGLLASQPTDEELFGQTDKGVSCPGCGFTLEQFNKDAVLGCPDDYEIFEKSLLPLIAKAHSGKTTHCGKTPSKLPAEEKTQVKLINLQQELDKAIQSENYEQAAKLRDKITDLQK
jgi:protein arginine kinase activator